MFKNLDSSEIEEVISGNFLGRLGCHADEETYIVPVSYAYDGDYIYFRSFEGLKLSMMRKNPKVCFQVDIIKDMGEWSSAIVWGNFEELTNEEDRNKGLKILMARILPEIASEMVKFSAEWPFPTSNYSEIKGVVFRIQITKKSGRAEHWEKDQYSK